MPRILHKVPPLPDYIQKNLEGFSFKKVTKFFGGTKFLEVIQEGKKVGEIHARGIKVFSRSFEPVAVSIAKAFESTYSESEQKLSVPIMCSYERDYGRPKITTKHCDCGNDHCPIVLIIDRSFAEEIVKNGWLLIANGCSTKPTGEPVAVYPVYKIFLKK